MFGGSESKVVTLFFPFLDHVGYLETQRDLEDMVQSTFIRFTSSLDHVLIFHC